MSSNISQTASKMLHAALPDLRIGAYHTVSAAWHGVEFVGPLVEWETFERDVIAAMQPSKERLDRIIVSHERRLNVAEYYMSNEHVQVGDEHGVQGRFQQNIGQIVTATLRVGGINETFADYKASTATVNKLVPDIVIIGASTCDLHAVGEVKVPWVAEHDLDIDPTSYFFKVILGQIARYMYIFKVKYGFLTNYNQTIFFKQEATPMGIWELHYS